MPPHKSKTGKKPTRSTSSARPAPPSRPNPGANRNVPQRGLSTNMKVSLGMIAAALAVFAAVFVLNRTSEPDAPATAATNLLVRPDSHQLSTATDGKVTVVEFLDFECESCGAAYPGVEKLRAEYGDRITYVVRYFPIESHPNAYNAAHAAEAAAQQGKFEEMYVKLFDNQTAWGHNDQSQVETFVGYAREIGLDVDKFRADLASPATEARVRADSADGLEAGVQGTPTFFINGTRFTDTPSYEALKSAVDAGLAQ